MTNRQWNLEDYQLDFPDVVVNDGPVTATPVESKVFRVVQYLITDILPQVNRCLNADAEIAGLILTLAAVDYMAGYYVGRQSTSADFKAFVEQYFPMEYRPFKDPLYDQIRSGLMHNLVILNPWRDQGVQFKVHPNSPDHLIEDSDGNLVFSVAYFLEDTKRALVMYQYDLIMKRDLFPDLVRNFHKRFNRLDGRAALMTKVPN